MQIIADRPHAPGDHLFSDGRFGFAAHAAAEGDGLRVEDVGTYMLAVPYDPETIQPGASVYLGEDGSLTLDETPRRVGTVRFASGADLAVAINE